MGDRPQVPKVAGNGGVDPLTGIPLRIHYAATPHEGSEADRIMVQHFLETLADIALAVARRQLRAREQEPQG